MNWVDLSHTVCSSNIILYVCSIFVSIEALDRGGGWSRCHVPILRNNNVALSNLRNDHVTLSILRQCHVPCHYVLKKLCRMSLSPKKVHVVVSNLGV